MNHMEFIPFNEQVNELCKAAMVRVVNIIVKVPFILTINK